MTHESLRVGLVSPIACRCAGLRTTYIVPFRWDRERGDDPDHQLAEQRRTLWSLLDEPSFVGCMATMNPRILEELRKDHDRGRGEKRRNSAARHGERLLYRFLSRFVGRNDITGMAGTCFWGRFVEGDGAPNLRLTTPSTVRAKRRLVYASPAHLAHLAQSLRRRIAPSACRPMLAPRYRLTDGALIDSVDGRVVALDPTDAALLRRCTGQRRVEELEDAEPAAALARLRALEDRGIVELHGPLPELIPMGRRLAYVVERLRSHPSSAGTEEVAEELGELADLERRLRSCSAADLVPLIREAETLAAGLTGYRPVDPAGTLRRLIGACAVDPEARRHLAFRSSDRFEREQDGLRDAATGGRRALSEPEAAVLERLPSDPQAGDALAELFDGSTDHEDAVRRLVEDDVLCLDAADPWDFREPTRSDVTDDPWERAWFAAALRELDGPELPAVYRHAIALLPSCRAVEQKSWEAVLPDHNPLLAPGRLRTALADSGIQPMDARKDFSFFLIDSLLDESFVEVGGRLRAAIETDLGLLLALAAVRTWDWERSVLLPGLRDALSDGERVPLARALRWTAEWAQGWTGPDRGLGDVELDAEWKAEDGTLRIEGLKPSPEFASWLAGKRLVSCVDLMIAGDRDGIDDGRWRLIVNEAHSSGDGMPETMHVPWAVGMADQGFTESHTDRVFRDDLLVLQPLLPTKQAHSIAWQLRGATLATRTAGTGTSWEGAVIPIGEADLVRNADGFTVEAGDRRYSFLSVDLCVGPFRTVRFQPRLLVERVANLLGVEPGSPAEGVTMLPKLVVGHTTVSRRTFVLSETFAHARFHGRTGTDLVAAGQDLRDDLDLPRWVFVSLAREKPFLCDLDSLFALEVLRHSLRRNTGPITLTVMDPDPAELWLEAGGGRVVSELRFVATADGAAWDPSLAPVLA